jgi:hypothetical protein
MAGPITCKLTGTEGSPVKAHIIPRSFYSLGQKGPINGKVIRLKIDDTVIKRSPNGEYDETILTHEGEKYFKEIDTYAFDCLIKRGQEATLYHDGENPLCAEIEKYDYKKLKLFFISLLWRAGVSTRPMFSNVSLGLHEANLRRMILESDPGTDLDYSVMLGIHRDTPDHGFPIMDPILRRDPENKFQYYHFMLGTSVACIKVDKQDFGESWREFVIKDGAPLRFVFLEPFRTSPLYKQLRSELIKSHKSS